MDKKARTFSPWSHLVSLIYAQLTHAIGLNDICDGLRLHSSLLVTLRAAAPPSRNNLSHANQVREASLAEKIMPPASAHGIICGYLLLRFLAFNHGWHHAFTRIFTLLRSALWRRRDLASLLQCHGTQHRAVSAS